MAAKPNKKKRRVTAKVVRETEDKPFNLPNVDIKPEVDEDPWENDGLTFRHRRFVVAYIGPAAGNATKAAEMAGYACENRNSLGATGWEVLRNPKVAEAIAHAFAAQKMTPEWAKAGLVELASASMANFLSVDAEGKTHLDFRKAVHAAAIGQIKEYHEDGIDGADGPTIIKRRIKLHDRTPALVALLKIHGLLAERHEHGGVGGGPIPHEHTLTVDVRKLSDEQLATLQRMIEDANLRGAGMSGSRPGRN